jgi:hypothetical protein
VVQILDKMAVRERVSVKDYHKIARENEFFIWHFLSKRQNFTHLSLYSYFDERTDENLPRSIHPLKYILDRIDIPYFETYTEDAMDFLMGFGFKWDYLYKIPDKPAPKEWYFIPMFIGFNRTKYVKSSAEVCYCDEFFLELIMQLNPKLVLDAKFD